MQNKSPSSDRRRHLFKSGALQNAIINSANFSSIATDEKGVIQIFNVGAVRMLGYAAVDVIDKITPANISDRQELNTRAKILSAEFDTPINPGFDALVYKASRGIEDIYELTYIRKDGSRFPAVVSVTALRDDQDNIIGYLLIGTDNTARKQIEAEQKKLDQRLLDQQLYTQSLIESISDALMTTDPSGIITDANKQMQLLIGYTRNELLGTPFKHYFTDSGRAEEAIKRVLSEKLISDYELSARAKNGEETMVSCNASTFYDREQKLQGVFVAARDVTDSNRLAQVLEEKNIELELATAVAEKANLAKSEFLFSMSHELRTPLNAILGFAQLMSIDEPLPTPDQQDSITQILESGWHLLNLINEILDLAKIESGEVPLSQEPVSLAAIMLQCQSMIEPQSIEAGIPVSFPPPDMSYYLKADQTRVKQVLINLLSNAIKYNSEQGTVEVTCTEFTPGRIRVSITDSGAGLSPEDQAQLFQPFNRLGKELGHEEGTGIGLVVCKRLIGLMDGIIGLESSVGVGSVFWFELPSVPEPDFAMNDNVAAVAHQAVQASDPARSYTLLYIEDNLANMNLIVRLIDRHPNIELLSAANGTLGIQLAHKHLPDVIVTDINMPDISGFEVLKSLHSNPATAQIPIIALSANAMPREIKRGIKAGFFRYLTKPIKIDEFMEAQGMALKFIDEQGSKKHSRRQNHADK
jgi:PAS domain S-box-containing protein